MHQPSPGTKRIIVADDDHSFALQVCQELRALGAKVLGPAPTEFYAMSLIGRQTIDLAILKARLYQESTFKVAERLTSLGVPIIFNASEVPDGWMELFRPVLVMKDMEAPAFAQKAYSLAHLAQPPMARTVSIPSASKLAPAQFFARSLARSKFGS